MALSRGGGLSGIAARGGELDEFWRGRFGGQGLRHLTKCTFVVLWAGL